MTAYDLALWNESLMERSRFKSTATYGLGVFLGDLNGRRSCKMFRGCNETLAMSRGLQKGALDRKLAPNLDAYFDAQTIADGTARGAAGLPPVP